MRCFKRFVVVTGIFALVSLTFPRDSYAYLDPGTGSYIFQLIIAASIGAAYSVKLFWGNIKGFFERKFSKLFGKK